MSKRRIFQEPSKAVLVLAVMWRQGFDYTVVLPEIENAFGAIHSKSQIFSFSHTAYYEQEMGQSLEKVFIQIEELRDRKSLIQFKHFAKEIEDKFLDENTHRLINIDPLLVALENIVIATSKQFPHRAYLGEGVYADVAFVRQKGKYQSLPWTYLDYIENLNYFEQVRSAIPR